MKPYTFQVAPNPTKVRLYLAEKAAGGTTLDITQVTVNLPKGEQRKPEHLAGWDASYRERVVAKSVLVV